MLRRTWPYKKLGEKYYRRGKRPLLRTKVIEFNKWLSFLACLELGLHVNHHELIPCFSCELAEMRHVSLPKKGEPGAIMRDVFTNWLSPGTSPARGTINASDYLHVLVLSSRNAKEPIEQRNK